MNSAYNYPIVLTREATKISGFVYSENSDQPLHDIAAYNTILMQSEKYDTESSNEGKKPVSSYVYVTGFGGENQRAPLVLVGKEKIDVNGVEKEVYKYSFSLNVPANDGREVELFLETPYGQTRNVSWASGKYTRTTKSTHLHEWPEKIVLDGGIHNINDAHMEPADAAYAEQFSQSQSFKLNIYELSSAIKVKRGVNYTAKVSRIGYADNSSFTQSKTASDGIVTFVNIKKGFYKLNVYYDSVYQGYTGYEQDYTNTEYIIFVDDGGYVLIKRPIVITYQISFTPTKSDEKTPLNKQGILGTNGGKTESINVVVKVDGTIVENVRVKAEEERDGTAVVTFVYSVATESIVVDQTVLCFEQEKDFLKTTLEVEDFENMKDDRKYEASVNLPRCEDVAAPDDHIDQEWLWYVDDNTKEHYQECTRCGFQRNRSAHYVNLQEELGEDASELEDQIGFYGFALTANTNTVGTAHLEHCTVCDKYDKQSSCTPTDSWTPIMNNAVSNNIIHNDVHSNNDFSSYSYLLLKNNIPSSKSKSDKYHYQYCTECKQRTRAEQHSWNEYPGDDGKTYKYGDYNCGEYHVQYCGVCSYMTEFEEHNTVNGKTGTEYYDKDYKKIEKDASDSVIPTNAVYSRDYTTCIYCGHRAYDDYMMLHSHNSGARCGGENEKAHPRNWGSKVYGCESKYAHCWSCGTMSPDYTTPSDITESEGTAPKCTLSHSGISGGLTDRKGGSWCISCSGCGYSTVALRMQGQKVNGSLEVSTSSWCHIHVGKDKQINWVPTSKVSDLGLVNFHYAKYDNIIHAYTDEDGWANSGLDTAEDYIKNKREGTETK